MDINVSQRNSIKRLVTTVLRLFLARMPGERAIDVIKTELRKAKSIRAQSFPPSATPMGSEVMRSYSCRSYRGKESGVTCARICKEIRRAPGERQLLASRCFKRVVNGTPRGFKKRYFHHC